MKRKTAFELNRDIPFMLAKTHLLINQNFKPERAEHLRGMAVITKNQRRILSIVGSSGPVLPSNIADFVALDRAVVTRSISELLQKGLVTLAKSNRDRRNKLVALTPLGEQFCQRLFLDMHGFGTYLEKSLSVSEKKTLINILEKLNQATNQYQQTQTGM